MSRSAIVEDMLAELKPAKNGWWRGACPFCAMDGHVDRKLSFGLQVGSGVYSCFRCGVTGHINVPDDFTLRTPRKTAVDEQEAQRPPDGYVPIASQEGLTAECLRPARAYLKRRGIGRALAKEASIGACATGKFHGRVIVPVLDGGGKWVGWVGRTWADGGDRPYLYPSGEWRGASLYNAKVLRVETDVPVAVVEGVFDALALWPNAVAVLGKPSEHQVEALVKAKRPVAVVLDGDAWREGWSLATRLRFKGKRAGYVRLAPGVDPDEVPREQLETEMLQCLG